MRNPLTVDEARVLEANGYGERILDTANAELNALIELARELTASNEQAVESSFNFTLLALLIGTAVAMLFAGAAWFVLSRAIAAPINGRSEEHTSELQSLMRISYAVFCLKKKKHT